MLYPASLPTFSRHSPDPEVEQLVRWYWISQWDLEPGRVSRQELLAFPALNLVVEDSCVGLSGLTTRRSHRDLVGRGWAVGALLRPAATAAVTADPAALHDVYARLDEPGLHAAVCSPLNARPPSLAQACAAVGAWLRERVPAPSPEALLANDLVARIEQDSDVRRVEDVARALSLSVRTVQRLARAHVGLTPLAMIRRRRLQEAAALARDNRDMPLAHLAADLGYSDQAHLVRDFRDLLGFTPGRYRREVTGPRPPAR